MNKKYIYLIIILLFSASIVAFGRIGDNDFINFDDKGYITENHHIKLGVNKESIKWAFTSVVLENWVPLSMISFMLDWSLFGANASGHHIVNLLLHIGAVILLFLFLNKTTKNIWPAAFTAALFALHPLRVESVAWAAERKDVLSMFFGMASLYAYAVYAESFKLSRYFLCLALFALSILSKAMLITLPFIFLLLDYWPLGRWPQEITERTKIHIFRLLIWEKIPFFCLTFFSSIITFLVQYKAGSVYPPLWVRISNAFIAYVTYLKKTFWPFDLALVYFSSDSFPLWYIIISIFIIMGMTIIVIYCIKQKPFLFVGWFWYLGTLIPVIGLVPTSTLMADHYTYLSSIGIAVMLSWGIPSFVKNEKVRRRILFPAALLILSVLILLSWQQCGYWKNSIVLWNHTVKVARDNYLSYSIRGWTYAELFHYHLAIRDFNQAISLKPDFANNYYNRGTIYHMLGMDQQAMNDFNKAIILKPDFVDAYNNRGNIYGKQGHYQYAIEDFNKVIDLNCRYIKAYNNRGLAYREMGHYKSALEDFNKAIGLDNSYAEAYYNRGMVYSKIGQHQLAFEDLNKSLFLKPNYAKAYESRGAMYFSRGEKILGCYDAHKSCEHGICNLLEEAKRNGYCR